MRNSLRLLCLLIGCNLCCGQTPSPSVRPFIKIDAPTVALTHARVIDGTGAPAREDQTIVISHGKIVSVSEASVAPPKEAQILDLKDYSVIPGMVGMHDHMFYPAGGAVFHEMAVSFPRLYLAGGVTTIRTTGSIEPYTDLLIKKGIDSGQTVGPHMHVTGPYLEGPGSFTPQMTELKTPEEAVATVNFWIDRGVDNFKAYNFVSRAVLGAAIQAAHKRGVNVTGHLCSSGFRDAAALGIDNLDYGVDADTEFYSGKKPDECPDNDAVSEELIKMKVSDAPIQETIRDLVAHHVALT